MVTTSDPLQDLTVLLRTRHNALRMETADEGFALELCRRAAARVGAPVYLWNVADGLAVLEGAGRRAVERTHALVGALNHLRDKRPECVCVVLGAQPFLRDPLVARLLRNVTEEARGRGLTLVLIDAEGDLPAELVPVVVPFPLALPGVDELRALVRDTLASLPTAAKVTVALSAAEAERMLDHLRGLTRLEARQLVLRAALDDARLDAEDLPKVLAHKRERFAEEGVVEFLPVEDRPQVGGLGRLLGWLELRKKALTPEARAFGIEPPRGVLLLGVQGCGKSLCPRALAASWALPLLRLDVGRLYDRFVGESERKLRQALGVAGSMAPCVLWIDEIEKAFGGLGGNDGGVSQRMFGALLTWLQEHRDPVFVVGTANDITQLPPELLRKGRFDELFFVDLPTATEREAIVAIHLKRRGRDPGGFDLGAVAAATEGFSGAELEQCLLAALYAAFGAGRALTTEDLVTEARGTRPLGVVAAERIQALRAWARDRCVPAS
jgi:AAA+ superfamily predicted ATPase